MVTRLDHYQEIVGVHWGGAELMYITSSIRLWAETTSTGDSGDDGVVYPALPGSVQTAYSPYSKYRHLSTPGLTYYYETISTYDSEGNGITSGSAASLGYTVAAPTIPSEINFGAWSRYNYSFRAEGSIFWRQFSDGPPIGVPAEFSAWDAGNPILVHAMQELTGGSEKYDTDSNPLTTPYVVGATLGGFIEEHEVDFSAIITYEGRTFRTIGVRILDPISLTPSSLMTAEVLLKSDPI